MQLLLTPPSLPRAFSQPSPKPSQSFLQVSLRTRAPSQPTVRSCASGNLFDYVRLCGEAPQAPCPEEKILLLLLSVISMVVIYTHVRTPNAGEAPAGFFSKWSNAEGRSGPMVRARHACLLYMYVAFPSSPSETKKQTTKQGQHHPPIAILTQAANWAPRGRRGRRGGRRGGARGEVPWSWGLLKRKFLRQAIGCSVTATRTFCTIYIVD